MVAYHHEPQGEVINENDWYHQYIGGPTNSTSQTFEYGGEGGARFTANGLGGQDVYPQTIDFLGDQISNTYLILMWHCWVTLNL